MKIEKNQIGQTVFILFDDPLFDNVWRVGNNWLRKRDPKFLAKLEKFENVPIEEFDNIYYCYECQRLEDGCHRSWTMRNKGHQGYTAFVGRTCWAKIFYLHRAINNLIKHAPSRMPKDLLWTVACKDKKWNVLSKIDFSGKTYLDVGSQSGYSAFMGWNRGAIEVVGVELRKEIFDIAERMKGILNANEITFYNADWLGVKDRFDKFDIVSCMGLMHYFKHEDYETILDDLCKKALHTLILELRVKDCGAAYFVTQNQTLIAVDYLERFVMDRGFKIINKVDIPQRHASTPGKRGLWIMEKI